MAIGADKTLMNQKGQTALSIAQKTNRAGNIKALKSGIRSIFLAIFHTCHLRVIIAAFASHMDPSTDSVLALMPPGS